MEQRKIIQNATRRNKLKSGGNDVNDTIEAEGNLQDVIELLANLRKNKEPLLHCSVFIELKARSMDALKELQSDIAMELTRSKISVDRLTLRQKEGFLSVIPTGYNQFGAQYERVLPASSVANLYPFNFSGKTDPQGLYLGRDKYGTNILVDFDRRAEDKTTSNVLILGNSGQGKSYLLKLILTNIRESGKAIICLDPESEYEELCNALGGCYIDFMSGEYTINPLEPKAWTDSVEDIDATTPEAFKKVTRLSQHIAFLKDFFRSYKDFSDTQIDTIEILLSKLYARFGITDATDYSTKKPTDFPIMEDFYKLCEEEFYSYDKQRKYLYTEDTLQDVCLGIHSMCVGAESTYFNGHTNITDLHELYGRLVEKGFKLSEEDVSCEHERLQNDDTIIRQMCILFSLVKYSDADKTILTYVSIIPNLRFEFKQAKQWFRIQKNSSLMKLYKMGMLEHITNNRKHIYWMHSVIAAAVREQQKEHLYTLSRPFVDILCEELNTGQVFGKEYEKAYLIPFSWSIADIMEKHWCVEDDTDYLTSLFHICFSCSNYILCEKIIDIVIRVQTDNPAFTAEDLAYSYRNKIDLLMQFDKVEEAAPLFKEVERLMSITDLPENKRNILSYQYGIYNQIRGKYDKAREYFRYCIDCAEKEESITREKDISTAYANMARMLVEAGDFFEAYKCIKKAINAEKEDELDSDQIVCYSTLAGICTELMQAGYGTTYIDEAIAAFDKVIKFREKHLGKHHADTAVIYHDYSYFWYVCGVLDKALEYNEKAYKIDEELFAEHSITRMRTLNTKALIIWDQGDYDKACSTLEYIIKTTEQMGNNYLVDLFDFSFNYARCLHEKGNDTLSKEYYNKCIDIWDSMSGGGSRNLCLVFQEYGDILFSEMNPGEALSKYESALKYNTEDWYIEVDLIDSIAACMMLIGQTDESLQKFAWLLQTLAEDDVKDAETKFQLCNNLACVLNSETEEEIEYKESLFDLVKDDAAVLSYAIHYLDDWLPDSAE